MHARDRSDRARFASINITPFVDVTLVLLVIFMIVTPMIDTDGVMLPRSRGPAATPERPLTIAVHDGGVVVVGGVVVRRDEVPFMIERLSEVQRDTPIVVRGDRRLSYGSVLEVLRWVRDGGFHEVLLATERSNS